MPRPSTLDFCQLLPGLQCLVPHKPHRISRLQHTHPCVYPGLLHAAVAMLPLDGGAMSHRVHCAGTAKPNLAAWAEQRTLLKLHEHF